MYVAAEEKINSWRDGCFSALRQQRGHNRTNATESDTTADVAQRLQQTSARGGPLCTLKRTLVLLEVIKLHEAEWLPSQPAKSMHFASSTSCGQNDISQACDLPTRKACATAARSTIAWNAFSSHVLQQLLGALVLLQQIALVRKQTVLPQHCKVVRQRLLQQGLLVMLAYFAQWMHSD